MRSLGKVLSEASGRPAPGSPMTGGRTLVAPMRGPDWSELTELRRFRRETAITTYTVCAVGLSPDNYPLPRFGVGEHEVWTLR